MKNQWGWFLTTAVLSVTFAASEARAQARASISSDTQSAASSGQVPLAAGLSQGWEAPFAGGAAGANAYPGQGAPFSAPASYYQQEGPPQPFPNGSAVPMAPAPGGAEAYGTHPYMADGYESGCESCGGAGCGNCSAGIAGGMLGRAVGFLLPYSEGGRCAPRWYDITADVMFLTREDVSRRIDFASDGVLGPIVLSTDDLDFDHEPGLRFTGSVQLMAGTNLEMTYFGMFNFATGAGRTSNADNLFSVYSAFGTDPLATGYDQTDRSPFQRITYSSSLDNFELSLRRRWIGPNCRVQGSWLAGVRYVYVTEDFQYNTRGRDVSGTPLNTNDDPRQSTEVTARNSLTGFQLGGDLWTTLVPGISVGGEFKAGVYGNYGNQSTMIAATDPFAAPTFFGEDAPANDIALVGEGRFELVYRTTPNWSVRAGYTFLVLDGVVLAPENFNSTPPPIFSGGVGAGARQVMKNDNGDLFYHGAHFGFEWMW